MVEQEPHPLVLPPPGGLCWRRAERRRPASGPEIHAELVVLHGLAGRARYLLDGAVHALGPGVLLWALAGQRHVLLDESSDFDQRVLLISDRVLPQVGREGPPLHVSEQGTLAPRLLAQSASHELETVAQAVVEVRNPEAQAAGLRWWLLRAWRHWEAAEHLDARRVHPAVTRAAWMLRDDPVLDLRDVAQRAGLSPGRLSRLFAAQTGRGLAAYRTDMRLDRAEALYRETRTTWLAASYEAGFGSYAQFYRAYRARHGAGPRGGRTGRADP